MMPPIPDPKIKLLLQGFPLSKLHTSTDTVYALRPDLRLAYVNQGWMEFASRNGAETAISSNWPLGRSIQDAIPDLLRPFFLENFEKCLFTGSPWQHRYECSSPDVFREFLMTTYPLEDGQGFLVVHSLVDRAVHQRMKHAPVEKLYRNDDGLIIQCVHCRRVQRADATLAWDWVPDWVESYPSNASHGFCEPCYGFYYPQGRFPLNGYPKFFRTSE